MHSLLSIIPVSIIVSSLHIVCIDCKLGVVFIDVLGTDDS